jgi:Uma2 family endonuclease
VVEEVLYALGVAEQQEAIRRRRFTVEEYHKMGEAGILGEDDRVELIDGEVLEMTPIGWRHVWCVRQLIGLLASFAETSSGVRYEVDAQNPITLGEHGEPRPDLVLLLDPQVGRLPGPGEVALVVEVADTSLAFDRDVKLPRYAEAGIAEAWLVDLSSGIIEVHSGPGPGGYRRTTRFGRGDRVESATIPDLAFDTSEVLPPKEPDLKG